MHPVKQMEDTLIFDQRGWNYYSSLFEKAEYGKEFRIYQVGEWLLNKEREFFTRTNSTLKKQNRYFMISDHFTALFTFIQQKRLRIKSKPFSLLFSYTLRGILQDKQLSKW